jgi:hypothetical protein
MASRGAFAAGARPTCRSQGSSRRSGRFESVALSSAGANWVAPQGLTLRVKGSVSRFRFPGGL